MPEVFVSHSSKDKSAADASVAVLEKNGITCWVAPRNILPGHEWGEAILQGIETCSVFLLLFSDDANESPQVRREVERAVHKGLIVVPVRLEDVMPRKSLEYFISSAHWMDAFPHPFEAYLGSLAEAIHNLRNPLPGSTPPPRRELPVKKQKSLRRRSKWILSLSIVTLAATAVITFIFANRHLEDKNQSQAPEKTAQDTARVTTNPNPDPAPVKLIPTHGILIGDAPAPSSPLLQEKLHRIILPKYSIQGVTLEDAVELLREKSRELDTREKDPALKGVNFILDGSLSSIPAQISLDLEKVPLGEALRYVTELAQVKYRLSPSAINIIPIDDVSDFVTRLYPLSAQFLREARRSHLTYPPPAASNPFGGPNTSGGLTYALSIEELFLTHGITFPTGTSAVENYDEETILIRSTSANHKIIGDFIETLYESHPEITRPKIPESLSATH